MEQDTASVTLHFGVDSLFLAQVDWHTRPQASGCSSSRRSTAFELSSSFVVGYRDRLPLMSKTRQQQQQKAHK